ncbi:MAG TPA: cysteine synthase A [Gemmatimonadaceae bacterium]
MPRGRIFDDITQTIGETPLIRLKRLGAGLPGHVVVKHEGFNPFNSVKDRIGVAMLGDAIARGVVKPGMIVVEPTSGNTGIGLAFAAAVHGLRLIIVMPDSMTVERRSLLRALGATVVLTEGAKGMKAAIARAEEIVRKLGQRAWMPQQFANPANPAIHYRTTGPEIWTDTEGAVDMLVSGVGTGGTLTGTGKYLREKKPTLRIVAVEPVESAVLSGGAPSPHKQQGIGAGFIPEVLDTSMYDEVVQVRNDDAIETTRRMAREEGIFAGISSGSVAWAALQIAARPDSKDKLIVAVLPDFGERYLSNPVYAELPPEPLPAEVAAALNETPLADVAAAI